MENKRKGNIGKTKVKVQYQRMPKNSSMCCRPILALFFYARLVSLFFARFVHEESLVF